MERLRQRTTIGKSRITGSIFYKPSSIHLPSFTLIGITGGIDQTVRDQIPVPQKWKRRTKKKQEYSTPNVAQMSKVEFLSPKREVETTYKYEDANYRISLRGANIAQASMVQSTTDPFYPPPANTLIQVRSDVASYLYQRALSKASSAQYDFGVTIGELAETAAFLAKPLQTIVSLSNKAFAGVSQIRSVGVKTYISLSKKATKRQIRRLMETTHAANPLQPALRVLDESANHWLAYKFGILPILDDIQKALDFKQENIQRQLGIRTVRVKSMKLDTTVSRLDKDNPWYSQTRGDYYRTKRVVDQHIFGLYFRNEITDPLANFMEELGFSMFSPFHLAYELIPLSFVVDRFIDIKSFVKGNLGSLNKQIIAYYCTRKIESVYTQNISNLVYYSGGMRFPLKTNNELASVARVQQMARIVNTERPNFPVVNPYWRESLIADATNLSLIWGRLRTFVGK